MPHWPCWANLNGLRISAPALCEELDLAGDLVEVRLAVVLVERRLGIEQIHLARAAVHEQVDDGLGLRREVRRRAA